MSEKLKCDRCETENNSVKIRMDCRQCDFVPLCEPCFQWHRMEMEEERQWMIRWELEQADKACIPFLDVY